MARIIKLINSAVVIVLVTATILGVSYALKCMISAKIEEERENKQRIAQEEENSQQQLGQQQQQTEAKPDEKGKQGNAGK